MKTAEKMIPKAKLLRALHEIMGAARDPDELALMKADGPVNPETARAFTLGWIEAIARDALGAEAPTTGWLAADVES